MCMQMDIANIKTVYTNVPSSFIYDHQKLDREEKQCYIHYCLMNAE